MNKRIQSPAKFKLVQLLFFMLIYINMDGQGYISPFKYENGTQRMKTRDEIRQEEARISSSKNYSTPKEFNKPKSGINGKGEIWIDGYCRYRPAAYSRSRYNENMSEIEYCRAAYPYDTIVVTDDFSGNGTIPWAANAYDKSDEEKCKQFQQRLPAALNDGLPFPMYDSLKKLSWYHVASTRGYKKDREYEFSRSVSFWIKRKSGSEKTYIKFNTEFPFSNGKDYTYFEINDNGQFKISAFCDNCKDQFDEKKSGKSKTWKEGDWNEITVKKDEFNTVSFYMNDEKVFQYQVPDIPISVRFAEFSLSLPADWEKKKLMYHIGRITSISYPKMN